jgi:hypothetical protein
MVPVPTQSVVFPQKFSVAFMLIIDPTPNPVVSDSSSTHLVSNKSQQIIHPSRSPSRTLARYRLTYTLSSDIGTPQSFSE